LPFRLRELWFEFITPLFRNQENRMSLVQRTAKKSPRLIVIGLLITLVSTFALASKWDSVVTFAQSVSTGFMPVQIVNQNSQTETPSPKTVNNESLVPLVGTYNIPGDYTDLAAAIADLNTQGVGGAVTLNLVAGNPQTAPAGGYVIGGTGSLVLTTTNSTNTVTIQGNGNTITAPTPQTSGALTDAIFKLIGADWITISGFSMTENAANTTTTAGTNNMTEFGVALFYVTTTDGAQNNTITGNTIDLNRTYQNTFGLYSNSTHSSTSITTSATATGAAGSNAPLTVTGNNITDVNMGIVIVGPTAAADNNDGITIGGSAPNANTLTNFGTTATFSGYLNVSGTVNGILVRNSKNFNISFNGITSSVGGVTAGTLNGIQIPAFSNAPTGTFTNNINNNTISLQSGLIAGAINGINVPGTSATVTSALNINNNNFTALNHTVAGTGTIQGIVNVGSTAGPLTHSISGNTYTNISTNTTGSFTFIGNSWARPTNGVGNINNNSIVTAFNKTGAGNTVTLYTSNSTSGPTISEINNNNNFSNITVTGATTIAGWRSTDGGSPVKTVTGNTFSNWTGGTSQLTGLAVSFSSSATVISNTVSNFNCACTIVGFESSSGTQTWSQNTVNSLTGTGTGSVTGILNSGGTTQTFLKNKVYGISNTNAGGLASGITVSAGTTINLQNNIVGDITAPNLNATNSLFGINISGGTTVTADFNTVYLNASSVGTNFGSSALNASSTPNVTLRNNVLVNTSTAAGTGFTVAYRRSSTTLTTYNAASNNNDFYAGTPSAANLIFYDGTNSDQTIGAYKTRVASRDSASFSENPPFISTTGSNANFLHISAVTPTQIESGGIPVAGITDDFDGNTRNVSTPDVGADEGAFTLLDLAAPSISYTALLNTSSTSNRVLTATITDASGVAGGALAPRIYFRKNAESFFSTQCVSSSPTYTCTIDYSLVGGGTVTGGDVIQYFVVAQDTAGNVGANPSGGFTATDVNNVTTPPTTPSQYTIAVAISGSFNVGTAETYTSLTNAGGIFEYINNNEVVGNITINITSDLTGELGTNALNQFTSPHTILIRPSGAARSITGTAASTALIRLNGASRVTIDGSLSGGTDRSLTIENTSTTTPQVVRFGSIGAAAITANTLKNCIVRNGVNTSSAVVVLDNAGTAGTFNNITIQNNDIQRAFVGIFTNATVGAGNGSGLTITQNNLDTSGANAIRNVGIYVQGADGATVSQNTVGNFSNTDGENDTGIWLAGGAVNSTVSANTVTTLGYTGTGAFGPFGIRDSGGTTASGNNITQNSISAITSNGTSSTLGPTVFGIENSSGGTIIQRNNVQGVIATNTGTFGAAGISITAGNNVVVRNNFVSNVTGDMSGGAAFSTSFGIFGIRVAAGTGHQVYNNSVNMYGLRTGTATTSLLTTAFAIVSTASTGMDVRNNIFANNITGGTTSIANVSVYLPSGGTSAMNLTWNNNSYYFGTDVARQGIGQAGTTAGTNFYTTLSALVAYTATLSSAGTNDNASLSSTGLVPFTSANDLHIPLGAAEIDTGATIATVTNDYDGDLRPLGSGYDIGADEYVPLNPGTIQFSSATYSVTEGTPTVTLTVTRTGGTFGAVTANYSLGGGTATGTATCGTPGEDYVNTGGSVIFADGDAADKTFTVNVCDDNLFEGSETFDATLAIGAGTATLGTPNPATVTITDNDAQPSLQFSTANDSVGEAGGSVTLTVTRTGATANAVSVNYNTANSTATGGASCTTGVDFVNASGTLIFASGDTSKTFNVTICDDSLFEGGEFFNAFLSSPTGGAVLGSPSAESVTITDNDTQPSLQFSTATDSVGEGGGSKTLTVTRTGATENVVSVDYATATGTATGGASCAAGIDFVNASGTLNFASGDTSKTFNVTVCDDSLFESSETFTASLSNQGGGATIGTPSTETVTITENDVQPTVQFTSATYTNADDIAQNVGKDDQFAPQVATITVTRAGATGDAFSVNYATSNGTATGGATCGTGSGVDYVSTSGTLNFAAGDMTKTFDVTVCTDSLFEGDETVNLTLTSPTAPVILGTPNPAVLTITDNDTQPSLQFSSATYSNSDDIAKFGVTTDEFSPSVATITVTRTGAVDNAVAVNYATSNGTATGGATCTAGIDYVSTSGTLNFAAGVISQTFNVTVCTDALFEGNETVNLTLSSPTAPAMLGTPNSAVLTIVDNDAQPSLQFSSPTYSVGEAGPTATITVTRTGAPDNAVSVNYTLSDGTATGGAGCGGAVDFVNTGGTLNFASGILSQTFNVTICDDASAESSETVNLALSSPTGAVLGTPNTAVLTITDNDAAPTLQFSAASVSVSESLASVTLTVTRAGATGNAVSVDYSTGGGTATAGVCAPGVDYNSTSGTLNFASGETSKTFNVTICNDAVYELNQTFDATLSNATGGATVGTPSVETVTINNDDAAPTVAINDISQAEGNAGTTNFQTTITVTGANEVTGGFTFQTADNSATAPSDYTAITPTSAIIPANVNRTTATLNGAIVLVNGDTTVEPDETFFLNGSSCTDCSFTDNQGVATIQNDDTSVQFAQPLYTVSEGVGSVTLTVTRVGSSNGAISVNYAFAGLTANGAAICVAGIDFAAVSGTLNWANGDATPKTFNVSICEDALAEGTESFVSQLQSPTGGATIGTQSSTQVDITDNDSDSTAPVITYTPIPNNPGTTVLSATITDSVGVTGANIFWSINGGSYTSAPCSLSGGTAQSGTWTCTITGTVNPNSVAYYVTATDAAANTATNPTGGVSAPNLFTIGAATVPAGTYTNMSLGSGATLGGDVVVNGSLALGGVVNTGANKLTLGCGVPVTGGGEGSYIVGRLERFFCGVETFTFNVGAPFALPPVAPEGQELAPEGILSNYSPLTVTITGGDVNSSLTVNATDAFLTGSMPGNSASRYWTITENGNLTADMSFTYRNEDVNGDENTYKVLRRAGGFTIQSSSSTNNAATNTATILNVSHFSDWGVGNAVPTAANASLGGQVLTASGQGIRNATVVISGGGLTAPRYATTGTFGYYQFDGLPVGESYVVTVVSKRYTFLTPSIVVNLQDNIADINFEAENK